MRDDAFEWDDSKSTSNFALHRVTFEAARAIFRDPFALDWLDEREDYGETRYVIVGITRPWASLTTPTR